MRLTDGAEEEQAERRDDDAGRGLEHVGQRVEHGGVLAADLQQVRAVATCRRNNEVVSRSTITIRGSTARESFSGGALWWRQWEAMVPQKHSVAASGSGARPKATVQPEPRMPAQTVKTRRILSISTPYRPARPHHRGSQERRRLL